MTYTAGGMESLRRIVVTAALCSLTGLVRADDFAAAHQRTVAANARGLHLHISLQTGVRQYRMGSTIQVHYRITADTPGRWVAGSRSYDRGGRSTLESIVTDRPEDASDTVRDFWNLYNAIYCRGNYGPGGTTPVTQLPAHDLVVITQYVQFSKPGRYRLYAITHQVRPAGAKPIDREGRTNCSRMLSAGAMCEPAPGEGGPALASENILTIEILPRNPGEDAREISAITKHKELSTESAFRLFEIGTPEARRAGLEVYGRGPSDANRIALSTVAAAPDPAEAVALFEGRLRSASQGVDAELLTTLALLRLRQRKPGLTGEIARRSGPIPLRDAVTEFIGTDGLTAIANLDARMATGLATTSRGLLEFINRGVCERSISKLNEHKSQLEALRGKTLAYISPDEQLAELRESHHPYPPAALKESFDGATERSDAELQDAIVLHAARTASPEIAGVLFGRLLVDPEVSWDRVLHLQPSIFFIDLDAVRRLTAMLESDRTDEVDRAARVLGFYSTDDYATRSRIRRVYEQRGATLSCAARAALLAYLLRADKQYALPKIKTALEASYAANEDNYPYGTLLEEMLYSPAARHFEGQMIPFVKDALHRPEPRIAFAAAILAQAVDRNHGHWDFVDPLVARLAELHEQWKDMPVRQDDPDYMAQWKSGYEALELQIATALSVYSYSKNDSTRLRRAAAACITDTCRATLRKTLEGALR